MTTYGTDMHATLHLHFIIAYVSNHCMCISSCVFLHVHVYLNIACVVYFIVAYVFNHCICIDQCMCISSCVFEHCMFKFSLEHIL